MSVTARVNALKVKDPVTGNYYGTMLMSDDTMADVEALAEAVASMAELGTDSTLSIEGAAADAKATGDAIDGLEDFIVTFSVANSGGSEPTITADKTFAEIRTAYLANKNIIFKIHVDYGAENTFQGMVSCGYLIVNSGQPQFDTCNVLFLQSQNDGQNVRTFAIVMAYDAANDEWTMSQTQFATIADLLEYIDYIGQDIDSKITAPSNPTSGQHLVYNGSAWTAQTLQVDGTPTASSTNLVASGGVKTALDAKQDSLTFDTTPTANSTNPVTSNGVKVAVDAKADPTVFATVSGTTVTQVGVDGTMYLCGELTELLFTAPATGITSIRFTSGTTPTVVTLTGITMPESWEGAEANTIYEINVLNGMGLVGKWSVSGS